MNSATRTNGPASPRHTDGTRHSDHPDAHERPARRPRLAIAAVAAAVLLAGGGGAWWATAASGGGDDGKASDSAPAPLRLDGPGLSGTVTGGGPGPIGRRRGGVPADRETAEGPGRGRGVPRVRLGDEGGRAAARGAARDERRGDVGAGLLAGRRHGGRRRALAAGQQECAGHVVLHQIRPAAGGRAARRLGYHRACGAPLPRPRRRAEGHDRLGTPYDATGSGSPARTRPTRARRARCRVPVRRRTRTRRSRSRKPRPRRRPRPYSRASGCPTRRSTPRRRLARCAR